MQSSWFKDFFLGVYWSIVYKIQKIFFELKIIFADASIEQVLFFSWLMLTVTIISLLIVVVMLAGRCFL